MSSTSAMQIGDLSRRSGCNIETIRYYERIGLLPKPARRGRYRQFGDGDAARLSFIRRARELGFSLEAVRALLDLAGGPESCGEVRDLAAEHLREVRGRIADLRRMEQALAATVKACGAGDNPACPLIETLAGSSLGAAKGLHGAQAGGGSSRNAGDAIGTATLKATGKNNGLGNQ